MQVFSGWRRNADTEISCCNGMLEGKRILVVVPARGGSKGIPLKNLRKVGGRSLLAWAGHVIGRLNYVDRAVVSTDHSGIADAARVAGLEAPFVRPEALSGDRVADWDVLNHSLVEMERIDGVTYDVVVMLQPTSPMRRPEHVTSTVRKLVEGGYDAVWTVSETDSKQHPLKQLVLNGDQLEYYDPRGAEIVARQQLAPVYHRNGVAYAISRDCLVNQCSIMGRHASAVVIGDPLVNIDSESDLAYAEYMLARENRADRDGVPSLEKSSLQSPQA
jgi:CMP-N,N'-diacetyllegionaminic acid synthase